jgi:hypothetical protein
MMHCWIKEHVCKIRVFWDGMPCGVIGRNISANFIPPYRGLTMKMVAEIWLGSWYVSAKQHGITSQEMLFLMLISMRISHFIVLYLVMTGKVKPYLILLFPQ